MERMDPTMRRFMLLGAFALLGLAAVGIASASVGRAPVVVGPQAVTVDSDAATAIASSAFEGFDADDYAGWTRHWSDAMRTAIPEEAFRAWRATVVERLGQFVSLGTPVLTSRQTGTYRWSFPVTFDRGSATVGFGFAQDGNKVEGVFVE